MSGTKKCRSKRDISPTHPDAAAIDIGATLHVAAVRPDKFSEPVRSFGTFTDDLHRLADWFKQCGVRTVAMESTGGLLDPCLRDTRPARLRRHIGQRSAMPSMCRAARPISAMPNGCSVCMSMDCSGPASG